ncbi:MAG TPA: alpha/beta hydrolase [Dehalococcoidia bacterium]|nr:alpha/beta hydrolase [Dehalococcoidia bacterium]
MDATVDPVLRRVRAGDLEIAVREWEGDGRPFVLVHGLASNAMTWDLVSRRLHGQGHRVIAIDQRGHGRSDKPESGYGFDEVTSDLSKLIEGLGLDRAIVAGQSWGGNVVLDFAARYPDLLSGLVLVDGGLIDLSGRPGATWEQISVNLKPPNLLGTPREEMIERFRAFHSHWSDEQIELQMGNYETLEDGTIRPWLTLDRHMEILRSLWEQKPSTIFERMDTPTLIAIADSGPEERRVMRAEEATRLEETRPHVRALRFTDAAHDIHIDQPDELTDWVLGALAEGFFG